MCLNIWDFLNYFFNEFLVSIIIGHSKRKVEDVNKKTKAFDDPKSFNINNNNDENLDFNEGSKLNENNQIFP